MIVSPQLWVPSTHWLYRFGQYKNPYTDISVEQRQKPKNGTKDYITIHSVLKDDVINSWEEERIFHK